MSVQERSMVMSNSTDNPAPAEGAVGMVERVARAINPQAFVFFDKRGRSTNAMVWALHQARAAISAMREPTEAMCAAGSVHTASDDVREESAYAGTLAKGCWHDMIDAALTGGPPQPDDQSGGFSTTQILP